MLIKMTNKETNEVEILEVISYNNNTVEVQAGKGVMIKTYDDNYIIEEVKEEEENNDRED